MNIFFTIIRVICQLLTLAIIIRAILSWFPTGYRNPLVGLLFRITEPVLAPLRHIVPRTNMLDITPAIAIILLQLICYLIP